MVSFSETEEQIFQQTVEWLSSRLSSSPVYIKQIVNGFQLDPFTRTFHNENGNFVYLTAKEFDLLYFLFCHKGQVFTKTNYTRMSGASTMPQREAISHHSYGS